MHHNISHLSIYELGAGLPDFTSSSLLVGLAYAIATLAGIVFFTSAIVIIAMPKFRKEIKTQTLILFAIAVSFIVFAGVAYYGVEANRQSFFGIDGLCGHINLFVAISTYSTDTFFPG